MPPCFHLIRGLPSDTADFYASLSVPSLRPGWRADCPASRLQSPTFLVERRWKGEADAMITCRKPSLGKTQKTRIGDPFAMPPLIPELQMTHSVSSCKYMSCCFSSLPRLRAAVIVMTTRLRLGAPFNLIPGLENRQLTCRIQNPPVPFSSAASCHRVARSTSHPSTRGQRIAARRA